MVIRSEDSRNKILEWTKELVSFATYRRFEENDKKFQEELTGAIQWIKRWARKRNIKFDNWKKKCCGLKWEKGSRKLES